MAHIPLLVVNSELTVGETVLGTGQSGGRWRRYWSNYLITSS